MSEKYYVTDSALSERFPLYTRANVGEVFPDPVTPLSGSAVMFRSEIAWREAWERIGAFQMDEFPADEMAQLGIVGGYCYLNASIIRLFGERAPGLTWKDMDEQFFGAQPGIPPYEAAEGDEEDFVIAWGREVEVGFSQFAFRSYISKRPRRVKSLSTA